MMPRGLIVLTVLFLMAAPLPAGAQEHAPEPGEVAHASEEIAHDDAQEAAAHGPKSYFGIPGWLLKLINMILFIGVLVYFLKNPLTGAFRERKQKIRREMEEAEQRRQKADQMAGEIQARLDQIEGEVAGILERAREEGERQKQQMMVAAQQESEKILAAARSQIDRRVQQARRELTDYAGELATVRAQSILEESVSADDRRKLFADSVELIRGGKR